MNPSRQLIEIRR